MRVMLDDLVACVPSLRNRQFVHVAARRGLRCVYSPMLPAFTHHYLHFHYLTDFCYLSAPCPNRCRLHIHEIAIIPSQDKERSPSITPFVLLSTELSPIAALLGPRTKDQDHNCKSNTLQVCRR